MFEAIALGGDDIFIIVPGNRSLEITNKIIEKFDGAFENKMTMSAGICIAKSSTPIRTLFEIAQYMLKSAKRYSRKTTVLKEQWMFSLFAAMSVSICWNPKAVCSLLQILNFQPTWILSEGLKRRKYKNCPIIQIQ